MVVEQEYCECRNQFDGHLSLAPVVPQAWVHGACMKPSYLWWEGNIKNCEECGGDFSSPSNSDTCPSCISKLVNLNMLDSDNSDTDRAGLTWAAAADRWRSVWREILGNRRKSGLEA